MPFDLAAPVIRHQALPSNHFLMTLEAPAIARAARPGQFVMIETRPGGDPLLRRPMSVCRVHPGRKRIEILYKAIGRGTRCLSEQRPGKRLRLLGPLGSGFRPPGPGRRPVLVAGGIGIAIFPFLAETLRREGHRPALLFGARTRADLVGLSMLRSRGVRPRLATEDGSAGTRGYVTRLLEETLRDGKDAVELYVCGPTPMLRAVGGIAVAAGVPCQLALEAHMPCGIGVCLGCVVACPPDDGGPIFRRVCTDGPVFDAAGVRP